jgi:hypothetical protein
MNNTFDRCCILSDDTIVESNLDKRTIRDRVEQHKWWHRQLTTIEYNQPLFLYLKSFPCSIMSTTYQRHSRRDYYQSTHFPSNTEVGSRSFLFKTINAAFCCCLPSTASSEKINSLKNHHKSILWVLSASVNL